MCSGYFATTSPPSRQYEKYENNKYKVYNRVIIVINFNYSALHLLYAVYTLLTPGIIKILTITAPFHATVVTGSVFYRTRSEISESRGDHKA